MARIKRLSVKTPRSTRENYQPPPNRSVSETYPWPREEGQPINLDDTSLLEFNCEGWDRETAKNYNALLVADILPTRFVHAVTLSTLGIDTDVFDTLQAIGITPLCYQTHDLYPDLVRQALATAEIGYDNPSEPTYVKLPQPDLTSLHEFNNIRVLPGPEFLCADPRIQQPDINMDDVEDVTPEWGSAYDLGPIEDDADDATYRRWMIDSQRKNNSLMKRILKVITELHSEQGEQSVRSRNICSQQRREQGQASRMISRKSSSCT
ncbi:hypothetical protein Bca101_058158 [Brassica carinata]